MKWWNDLRNLLKKRKSQEQITNAKEQETFFLFMKKAPGILTYLRREAGIPMKDLELVVIDNEEEPAWQVERILELLMPGLNLLYVLTNRTDFFGEIAEEALEEQGLLLTVTDSLDTESVGNLILNLHDWKQYLMDIGNDTVVLEK